MSVERKLMSVERRWMSDWLFPAGSDDTGLRTLPGPRSLSRLMAMARQGARAQPRPGKPARKLATNSA